MIVVPLEHSSSTRRSTSSRSRRRRRSPRPCCSARRTASASSRSRSAHARSATRSSTRPLERGVRSDRARLVAALAPPVGRSSRRRSTTCSARPVRGARRRLPAGRARGRTLNVMKLVVIGCGRVGSAVARDLAEDGWDVTAVDEQEEALARLGSRWAGGFVVGHGMDAEILRTRRRRRTPTRSSSRRAATTRTSSSARWSRSATAVPCVVVRVLDPARADFYAARGMRTICPTQTAISALSSRGAQGVEAGRRRRASDVRDRRRRRQGRRQRRPLAARRWGTR